MSSRSNRHTAKRHVPTGPAISLAVVSYATWILLTWTRTAEVLITGAVVATVVAVATAPLFDECRQPRLTPRHVVLVLRLATVAARDMVGANIGLARRIWSPSLPLRTGMIEVPTRARTDAGVATVGIVTSLIVDNQIVDVDRRRNRLLYHCVDVPSPDVAYQRTNGTVDELIARMERCGTSG